MDRNEKLTQLAALRKQVDILESEISQQDLSHPWQAREFYPAYYATTGFMLGIFGGVTSLLANVLGSIVWGKMADGSYQHPLRLIQVYLTFPLGEKALDIGNDNGLTLLIGCLLYLATGMLYGVLFQVVLGKWFPTAGLTKRLVVGGVLGLVVWVVNFYGVLSWAQPALFGGRWIFDLVPAWVAALTHLVYGWTMAIVYPLGEYQPYRVTDTQ